MICIYLPGTCITYMILFNSLVQYVAESFQADTTFTNSMKFRALIGIPATIFLYFPLSMKRDMSAFAYGGVASVIALLYVALIMVIEMPFYYAQSKQLDPAPIAFPVYIDWNIFNSCAITFFAYTC